MHAGGQATGQASIEGLVERLRAGGDPERAAQARRYLRSELVHWGTPVPAIGAAVADWCRAAPLPRERALAAAEALWAEPVHERRQAAVKLLARAVKRLDPADLALVERFVREAKTWAYVDELAVHVAAPLLAGHAAADALLDRWAVDPDFWVRRAALLAELPTLRAGAGDFDRFARHADPLVADGEFFIRKALGWVLRDTGRKRPALVVAWLLPRAPRCSGVTIREAVRHLPADDAARILAAWRDGPAEPPPWSPSAR